MHIVIHLVLLKSKMYYNMKVPYSLRLEDKMIKDVRRLACKSFRSVNGEFEYLIQKSITESIKINSDISKLQAFGIKNGYPCQTDEEIIQLSLKLSKNIFDNLDDETIDNAINIQL